ncbi:MAG: sulfotransferase domain-containing protein, partial [Fuerstiella sp.]
MKFRKVVWIAGVARSGTSWIGQIFNSHQNVRYRFQPLFSYEFKSRVNEDSTDAEHQQFLNDLWDTETDFLA